MPIPMRPFLTSMLFAALPAQEMLPISPLAVARLLPPLPKTSVLPSSWMSNRPQRSQTMPTALPPRLQPAVEPVVTYPPALPALPKGRWVKVVATGYSPHDQLDSAYHATKGAWRWKTATLTDVRTKPYGIAVPFDRIPRGAAVYVPPGSGYVGADGHIFEADDTGKDIRANTGRTGTTHIDLRFKTEHSARRYGRRDLWVFVYSDDYEQVSRQTKQGLIDKPER